MNIMVKLSALSVSSLIAVLFSRCDVIVICELLLRSGFIVWHNRFVLSVFEYLMYAIRSAVQKCSFSVHFCF